jgi:hypothetical protein
MLAGRADSKERILSPFVDGCRRSPTKLWRAVAVGRRGLWQQLDRLADMLCRTVSMGIVALITCSIAALAFVYFRTLRPLFDAQLPGLASFLHHVASVSLLFCVTANYVLCVFTDAGSPAPQQLAAVDPEAGSSMFHRISSFGDLSGGATGAFQTSSQQWRFCGKCRALKPPRAHHDSTTDRCYLRMCHFCPAIARVVGLRNAACFFRFVTSACVGCAFTASSCVWLLAWLPEPPGDEIFFVTLASIATGIATAVLATFHGHLLRTNQTTIECFENWTARRAGLLTKYPFDEGFRANVVDLLGQPLLRALPWWSVLFVPDWRPRPVPQMMIHLPGDLLAQLD